LSSIKKLESSYRLVREEKLEELKNLCIPYSKGLKGLKKE